MPVQQANQLFVETIFKGKYRDFRSSAVFQDGTKKLVEPLVDQHCEAHHRNFKKLWTIATTSTDGHYPRRTSPVAGFPS